MSGRDLLLDCDRIVVYDADEISSETLAAVARELDGRRALHLVADDAVCPPGDDRVWRRFPSTRSGGFRDYAIERIEQVLESSRSAALQSALTIDGVDVSQVALIDWSQRAADAILKAWLCRRILASPVRHVMWVPGQTRYSSEYAAAAGRSLRSRGIDVTVLAGSAAVTGGLRGLRLKNEMAALGRCVRGVAASRAEVAAATGERPRVLFAENYPKTAKVAAVAAKALEAAGDVDVWFVVTRRDTQAALRQFGLRRVVLLDQLVSKAAWSRSFAAQRRVVKAVRHLRASAADAGLGVQFAIATAAQWRYAAHMTVLWHDVVSRIGPHAVATTSQANIFARAAVAAGHQVGATSFFIQHGLLGHDRFESRVMAGRQLLWGEWDRQRRLELGCRVESLTVTGSPTIQSELLARETVEDPWSSGAPMRVLYLPSLSTGQWVSPANAARQRDTVVEAVRAIEGAELVVKIHPSERSDLFAGSARRVLRDGTAAPLIRHADVVIVSTSTSGLEACAMDKAVIVLRTEGVRMFRQYEDHDAVLFASDRAGLERQLRALRDDAGLRHGLRERRGRMNEALFDGLRPGATSRIADAIRTEAFARRGRAENATASVATVNVAV